MSRAPDMITLLRAEHRILARMSESCVAHPVAKGNGLALRRRLCVRFLAHQYIDQVLVVPLLAPDDVELHHETRIEQRLLLSLLPALLDADADAAACDAGVGALAELIRDHVRLQERALLHAPRVRPGREIGAALLELRCMAQLRLAREIDALARAVACGVGS